MLDSSSVKWSKWFGGLLMISSRTIGQHFSTAQRDSADEKLLSKKWTSNDGQQIIWYFCNKGRSCCDSSRTTTDNHIKINCIKVKNNIPVSLQETLVITCDVYISYKVQQSFLFLFCVPQAAAQRGDGYRGHPSPHSPNELFQGVTVLKAVKVCGPKPSLPLAKPSLALAAASIVKPSLGVARCGYRAVISPLQTSVGWNGKTEGRKR